MKTQLGKLPVEVAILTVIGEYVRSGYMDTRVMMREMIRRVMKKFKLTIRQCVEQVRKFLGQW